MRNIFIIFFIICNYANDVYGADGISSTFSSQVSSLESDQSSNAYVAAFLDKMKSAWDAYASERKRPSVGGYIRVLKKLTDKKSILGEVSISAADSMGVELKTCDEIFELVVSKKKLKKLINSLSEEVEDLSDLFPLMNQTIIFGKSGFMDILCVMPGNSVQWVERKLSFDDLTLTTIQGKKIKISEKLVPQLVKMLTQLKNQLIQLFEKYAQKTSKKEKKEVQRLTISC